MPTWMKVLLVVGVLLVVLIVGTGVAGFFLVRRYGPEIAEAGKQTFNEGVQYGQRTDNEGCVNEAVARQSRADGFTDIIKNTIFMRSCLDASRPTPGFCDNVPRATEFMKAIGWQAQQCKRYGLGPDKQCSQLFQQVQQFCEMRRMHDEINANLSHGDNDAPPPPPPPAPPPAPAPRRPSR